MRVTDLVQQPPRQGEVRVRITVAGICASDHHVMLGETSFPLPMVLGHEGAGIIEETGQGVQGLKEGDSCILSFVPSCGFCTTCRLGKGNRCETHRSTGAYQFDGTLRLKDKAGKEIFQFAKLGLFAETVIVPQQACSKLPEDVPMEEAALMGCAVATGIGAVINEPRIKPGVSIAVFGVGGVGLNALQAAKMVGAFPIIAVDINEDKLEFSRGFGATHVVNSSSSERDVVNIIRDLTSGGAEVCIDAFGGSAVTETMITCMKPGGMGIIVGLAPEGVSASINMVDLVRNEKTVKGSYYGSAPPHVTFKTLLNLRRNGLIDIAGLIKRRYKLEDINEAYHDLANGKDGRGLIVL